MRTLFFTLFAALFLVGCQSDTETADATETTAQEADTKPKIRPTVGEPRKIPRQDYVIEGKKVFGIQPGDAIADHGDKLVAGEIRTGEGTFSVYKLTGGSGQEVGYIIPNPADESKIGDIIITGGSISDARGIRVGDPWAAVRMGYPDIEVHGSEIESRTHAFGENVAYRLDVMNTTYEVNKNQIPDSVRITALWIQDSK